jgi:hypothetical protein
MYYVSKHSQQEKIIETMTPVPIGKLAAALAKAQAAFPEIKKDCTVTITPRQGRAYSYTYASLSTIRDAVTGPLAANGLAISQTFEPTKDGSPVIVVVTTLLHESGESIQSKLEVSLPDRDPKTMGGCITYGRRYALSAILCVAVEEDDDAGSGGQTKANGPAPARRANDTPLPQREHQQCASTEPPRGEPARNAQAWDGVLAAAEKGATTTTKPASPAPVVKMRDQAPAPTSLEPHQAKAADLILKYLADGGVPDAKRKETAGDMLRAMLPHVKTTKDIAPLDAERIRLCITLLPRVPGNSISDVNQYLTQQVQVQPVHQANDADIAFAFDFVAKGITTHDPIIGDDDVPF